MRLCRRGIRLLNNSISSSRATCHFQHLLQGMAEEQAHLIGQLDAGCGRFDSTKLLPSLCEAALNRQPPLYSRLSSFRVHLPDLLYENQDRGLFRC